MEKPKPLQGYSCPGCGKVYREKANKRDMNGYADPYRQAERCCEPPSPVEYLVCPNCDANFYADFDEEKAQDHIERCCAIPEFTPEEVYLEQLRFGSRPLIDITRDRFYAEREAV